MGTNILVLAAGQMQVEGYGSSYPTCLTELDGLSLIERIVINTREIADTNYTFALMDKEIDSYHLDRVVKLLAPGSKIVRVPEGTRGSACTALLAASQLKKNNSLLIISANELVDIDLSLAVNDFKENNLDGGTIIFRSIHPRYSYVKLNDHGLVSEASQKNPISQNATAGVFWFKSTEEFIEAAKETIRKSVVIDGKYYVAPIFNELLLKQRLVGVYQIDKNKYRPLKTERQLYNFESGIQ